MNKLLGMLGGIFSAIVVGWSFSYILSNPSPRRIMVVVGITIVILLLSAIFVGIDDGTNSPQ